MAAKDATIHRQHKEIEQLTAQIAALHLDKTRTVEAHQSRVRQLQDKFLADLEAGQNRKEIEWVGEMKLMRAELDREMALKLDAAQREAHEKAVEEMKKEYEAVVDMIKSQAKRDARERDLEKEAAAAEAAARLAKEVQEARDEAKREQQLRMQAEIDSLSRKLKEVKDEADAGNLHSHHHHQSSISKLQSQLADLTLQQQQCQLLLHSREKEISFLKNTVRLECEERMDLLSKVERLERRVSLSSSSTTIIANTLTNAPSAPSPSPSDPGPTPPASFTNQNKSSSHRSSLPNMSKGGTRGFIPPHLLAKIKSVNK